MKLRFEVSVDVNRKFYKSAISMAGVPGRATEARAELSSTVEEQITDALFLSVPSKRGNWDAFRLRAIPQKR